MDKDRFDLEENILEVWQTANDLNHVAEAVFEDSALDLEKAGNLIAGIAELHELRCKKLLACFEYLLETGKIKN